MPQTHPFTVLVSDHHENQCEPISGHMDVNTGTAEQTGFSQEERKQMSVNMSQVLRWKSPRLGHLASESWCLVQPMWLL
jgi:hypothetical protein